MAFIHWYLNQNCHDIIRRGEYSHYCGSFLSHGIWNKTKEKKNRTNTSKNPVIKYQLPIRQTCNFFVQRRKSTGNIARTNLWTLVTKNQSCICIHDLHINKHWTGRHIMLHCTSAPVKLHSKNTGVRREYKSFNRLIWLFQQLLPY